MSEWVDAKTRFPSETGIYLVVVRYANLRPYIDIACYYRKFSKWVHSGEPDVVYYFTDVITHWMPLPPMPGEEVT